MLILLDAWRHLGEIPLEKTTRAMRLLDSRCFELRGLVHEQFSAIWKALVSVNLEQASITINKELPGNMIPRFANGSC